jgi:hypothetical protein
MVESLFGLEIQKRVLEYLELFSVVVSEDGHNWTRTSDPHDVNVVL